MSPSPTELEGYLGTYFSEELDYAWVVRITNDRLSMWDPRTWFEFALRPVVRDVFQNGNWFFTFSSDRQGRVVGFTVDAPRSRKMERSASIRKALRGSEDRWRVIKGARSESDSRRSPSGYIFPLI